MNKPELIQSLLCLSSNLRNASRVVTQFYSDTMEESGLLKTQFTVLAAIGMMEEASVTQLADTLGIDQTTLTRNISVLVKHGWIETKSSTEDQRIKLVSLTPDGETALEQAFPLWQQAQQTIVNALGQADTERLLELLNKVVAIAEQS